MQPSGILGLVYGSFSYTKETHGAKIGPIELSVKDKQTVNVPVWVGVGAIVIGGVLRVFGGRGAEQAIRGWVNGHLKFTSNSSNSNTPALDSLMDRVGVCRDFAHLMIALCLCDEHPRTLRDRHRPRLRPGARPPDFQAYVEVCLGDS